MPIAKPFISISPVKCDLLAPSIGYSLRPNEVIIYTIYLPDFVSLQADLAQFLNSDECNRAERFHKEIDRNRFIVRRAILKFILAAYTQMDVQNIHFDYHSNKKPYLTSHAGLHFNSSHSEDFAVIAISSDMVGIDIESISGNFDFTNLLPEIFDHSEILAIQNADNQRRLFYTFWTRKEAFVKALGKGIDDDFKTIPCLDGQHNIDSCLLQTNKNWQVYNFELAPNYLVAIAFESLSSFSKNLILYSVPNTMKELLKMTAIQHD